MKLQRAGLLPVCLLLAACSTPPHTPERPADASTSSVIPVGRHGAPPEVLRYLNDAIDIMQNNSLRKHLIDWATFRASVLEEADDAESIPETYAAIESALQRLGDHHSSFMTPQDASTGEKIMGAPPAVFIVEDRFGYVAIPGYPGGDREMMDKFATDLQRRIQEIDSRRPCGWIVDLRGNPGGNMWPMLVGIGPILGDGKAGSMVDADGTHWEWSYRDGKGMIGPEVVCEVTGEPYQLSRPNAPVAVLFNGGTASSGEAIVLSFVGRMNTRTFGSKSAGLTTGNSYFPLSDGAMIVLTTIIDADRTGRVYGAEIIPDVQVSDNLFLGLVPAEVLQWLNSQSDCQ